MENYWEAGCVNNMKNEKKLDMIDKSVKSKDFNAKNAEDAKSRRDNLLYFKTIVSMIFVCQRPDYSWLNKGNENEGH